MLNQSKSFLATQDALEVMLFIHLLRISSRSDFTDVTLVSDDA